VSRAMVLLHSVASSWFSSLRLYYDARTNIHQIQVNSYIVKYSRSKKKCTSF